MGNTRRVEFEGFIVGYEEPPVQLGRDEYSILLDGSLKDDGKTLHEGYFYLVAPKSMEGGVDIGVGSSISGEGELLMMGEEPVVRLLKTSS